MNIGGNTIEALRSDHGGLQDRGCRGLIDGRAQYERVSVAEPAEVQRDGARGGDAHGVAQEGCQTGPCVRSSNDPRLFSIFEFSLLDILNFE